VVFGERSLDADAEEKAGLGGGKGGWVHDEVVSLAGHAYLFNRTNIQCIDHTVLHIANGQNKVLFDF
jgi:hypothetical protein